MRPRVGDQSFEEMLAEIEVRPRATWPVLVRQRIADHVLAQQALIWLHASAGECLPGATPSLGVGGERFELVTALDSGATASVWKAYDRKLGRHVAIKVFHGAESATIRQSLLEARASSEVISEHVVRVHDVHDADPPYIVLELVGEHAPDRDSPTSGVSAATLRPRDINEAVRWVRDIARGVDEAHLHDVFHRDLKPHNVLITPVSRRAKIADFGLAISAATVELAPVSGFLVAGRSGPARIAGTPEFMAPEQARGLPVSLDARDPDGRRALVAIDVWGLGAVAYDLLSGRPPWHAESGMTGWELAARGGAPPQLDHTRGGEVIPPRLRKIVERALAPVPADRYPSASAVAEELDAYLARRPTSFDRRAGVRFGLWMRRNPQLTVTAAVAVACAAMSFAAYATVVGLRRRSRELAAEMHEVETEKDALAAKASKERRELDDTEASLHSQTAALATVRRTLSDTQVEYQTIVAAKDHELQTADVATRELADQLTAARSDRDLAQRGRDLYEDFWIHARDEATQLTKERDAERRNRDAAIAARDQAINDREGMRVARDQAVRERDAARTERDREAEIRRRVETDLSQLAAELSKLRLGVTSPNGVGSGALASPIAPAPATPRPFGT